MFTKILAEINRVLLPYRDWLDLAPLEKATGPDGRKRPVGVSHRLGLPSLQVVSGEAVVAVHRWLNGLHLERRVEPARIV
jgi:hypothetical protein